MSLVKLSTLSLGLVLVFLPNTVIANKTPEHSVRITTNVRVRYEYVDNQLPETNASDDAVVTRISTHAAYQYGPLQFETELMDARIFKQGRYTPVGTDDTNALEPVQLAVSWRSVLDEERLETIALKAGRFTMDVGSRRLVARNRFRNTLNTFDGVKIDAYLSNLTVTSFYTLPVNRMPTLESRQSLNDIELDSSSSKVRFFGLYTSYRTNFGDVGLYSFQDKSSVNETQRNTFGHLANIKLSQQSVIDYEVAIQRGQYQSKQVRANFFHIALSSNFNRATVRLFYDFATGDEASTDSIEGFSTLFGARRFEYGPTGIFGLFARSNMASMGVSSDIQLNERNHLFMQIRAFDIHRSSVSGRLNGELLDNGDFLGTLSELRFRSQIAENMQFESGIALANLNRKVVTGERFTSYFYLQASYTF
ncbi:hypothetical protein FJN14_00310 [Alteromonas mediterranea]|uniref:alginate export family protein n=1 Tax=Alteromonas mediterranea TaxID=314275 RepID=UPI0011326C75|nr:alginate export family protein [Alteromonas mediterranea]QDG36967.1 hypothetical protein FJN14_00310 [Alteromonas mediterranea]